MPIRAHHNPTAGSGQHKDSKPTPPSDTDLHESDNPYSDNNSELSNNEDDNSLQVDTSWQQQPVRLPAYTPSSAAKETGQDSPPITPIDDPIYLAGSDKHFGFSSR
ncbi:hypothetical protein BG015_002425 [Linnemannia schmuckeri]|uniref:Uncharacterized protein n=1 Tax=Linnemannia schmuckeri TaxID=64567 RepID=A0A9P5S328_9FUNG|nr:hypothetical protein BG015_002425 [Linnemannia schmuckeri]